MAFTIPNPEQYMPRAAPTATDEPDDVDRDDYARVSRYIDSILEGEEPTAPMPESVRLTPWQAAGAALNPQSASNIIGLASQPVEARNLAAQREFERQMGARDRALGLATSMIDARTRRQPTRGQIRQVKDPVTGEMALQEFIPNPVTGGYEPGEILAMGPEVVKFLSSPTGYHPASGRTGEVIGGPRQAQGGGTIYPPPPAGVVSDIAASTATLSGIDDMANAYRDIRTYIGQQDQGLVKQFVGTVVGGSKYGGPFAPEYSKYLVRMRQSLNAYIKSVTGAQFSLGELEKYESQFPLPLDPPDVAATKINAVKQRALADMQAKMRAFPGAAAAGPTQNKPRLTDEELLDEALRP